MQILFAGAYHGLNPEIYGREVIDRCGFTEPPICEKAVSQFFGNKIEEVSPLDPDIAAKFPSIRKIFGDFKSLAETGVAVVMATHNAAACRYASKSVKISEGKLTTQPGN